jgi:hypothetical protein
MGSRAVHFKSTARAHRNARLACALAVATLLLVYDKGTGTRRLRIALEGNIAAGKSTLLRLLEDELDYIAVPEPLSKWQGVGANGTANCGGNLLELFYKDPKRWGYTFQTYAFLSRMMAQLQPPLEASAGECAH